MAIGGISTGAAGGGFPALDALQSGSKAASGSSDGTAGTSGFGDILRGKLEQLNKAQADGDIASEQMATGKVDDVAQTMMRIEQANVQLQMATQMRNKVIEAYQEILRMQM